MSNRRRPRNPTGRPEETMVDIPIQERSVHKRVPATIHWSTVEGVDREDDEVIGTAIIYDDGYSDLIINDDISADAKKLVKIIQGEVDHLSMEE